MERSAELSRRQLVAGGASFLALGASARQAAAAATPFEEAVRAAVGEAAPQRGRVHLDIPRLSENGNSVSLTVSVDSPMTPEDHVKTIHVFAEKNPYPDVARFHLGPRSGRAQVSTTIRLAESQRVLVVAGMSDGGFWAGDQEVIVTLSACIDGG
jgi:sulfur-oxidizing protein SoxY